MRGTIRSTATLVAALTSIVACSRAAAPAVAPVELAIAPLPDGGAEGGMPSIVGTLPPGSDTHNLCFARLEPEPIETQSGCQLDERLTTGPGRLSYPCSGDGPVEAVFADHRFEGTVTNGTAVLALTTELDWQDGCHWQTKQALRGPLRVENGAVRSSKLVWSYTEKPIQGTSCYGSCKARADVAVEQR